MLLFGTTKAFVTRFVAIVNNKIIEEHDFIISLFPDEKENSLLLSMCPIVHEWIKLACLFIDVFGSRFL